MNYQLVSDKVGRLTVIVAGLILGLSTTLFAGAQVEMKANLKDSSLQDWWDGKYLTGNWLGPRDSLADRGLKFKGKWRGAYYGILSSENGQKGVYNQEVALAATIDFAKLIGSEALQGLSAFGETRYRDNRGNANPRDTVKSSGLFNPSHFSSGVGWRLLTFGLKYSTPEMFGAEEFLTLTGGWVRPQKEFINQPLSKLFMNNAIESSKGGVGGNIPFSSSFSTWGGTVELQPLPWHYLKAGLFMAFPQATLSDNNGLMFQGYTPDPSRNDLFFMGETGITPEFGASKLPGHYAFGGYVYGVDETYGGNRYGFYIQADQMLFREQGTKNSSPERGLQAEVPIGEGLDFGETIFSSQGLRLFSLLTAAPSFNNNYPFYAHVGLVYEGVIPGRNEDQLMGAVGVGEYSNKVGATNSTVMEVGYRVQLNGWAFIQPYFQYLAQPNGTTKVANASIIGFLGGVNF